MNKSQKFVGTLKSGITDISSEYLLLAQEDEEVGRLLLRSGRYRHAAYFFIQAMEKLVRYKIFQLVNANNEFFRKQTRTHNLDELLDFLVDILGKTPLIKEQVKGQLENFVLEGVRFGKLHNDLRYPFYVEKTSNFALVAVGQHDAEFCCERLERLKSFLKDIDRLKK